MMKIIALMIFVSACSIYANTPSSEVTQQLRNQFSSPVVRHVNQVVVKAGEPS